MRTFEILENKQLSAAGTETIAVNICATILSSGRHDGRFSMSIDDLRQAMDLTDYQTKIATARAVERQWVRLFADQIELSAAGSYVAKETLDLPR